MLDLNHIYLIISNEWQTYNSEFFFSSGLFMYMAHKVSNLAKSDGSKTFWLMFSLLLLHDILQSNTILFNHMFYVAIAILVTHINLVVEPIKSLFFKIKQKRDDKYKQIVERNEKLENFIAKERREQERLELDKTKQEQQARFLNQLSKKFDSF